MTRTSLTKYLSFFLFITFFWIHAVKAGDFGEHKLIGDSAFRKYCDTHSVFAASLKQLLGFEPLDINSSFIPLSNNNPKLFYSRNRYAGQYPLFILNGKAVTYGDLTALSGDHSPNIFEAYRRFLNNGTFTASGFFNNLFDDVLNQYYKELKNLDNGGRGYNPFYLEFILLAAKDKSHFHIPAMPLRQEIDIAGERIYNYATDLLYSGLTGVAFAAMNRQMTPEFFKTNAVAKYCIFHTMAKTSYVHVYEALKKVKTNMEDAAGQPGNSEAAKLFRQNADSEREIAKKYLLFTLFINAFSEHYLQDMFAGGHFFADRNARDFFSLEAKGIHDFFGRHGLNTFVEGKPVTLLGDGKYTCIQLNLAVQANFASLQDVFDVDTSKPRQPEYEYLQLLRTPAEEPGQLFPALKLIPDVPLGKNFSSQRKSIDRSLNGLNYGSYALGSSKSYGAGITTGFNYLLKSPDKRNSPLESYFGLGFNVFFEATSDSRVNINSQWQGRLGLGMNFLFFDWVYANASIISSLPVAVSGKFEQGIQIKLLPWKYGIHIGVVEYTTKHSPSTQFTIGVIHY